MPRYKAPGVYIRPVAGTTPQVITASPSNFGCLGWSFKGPVDEAVLCTSYPAFQRRFGDPVKQSLLAIEADAFFKNLGERFWAVRVSPADAEVANGGLLAKHTDVTLKLITAFAPAGTVTVDEDASVLADQAGLTPIVPSSIAVRWRSSGAPVADEELSNLAGDADLLMVDGTADYAGHISGALPAFDPVLDAVVRGTVVITWDPDGLGDRTINVTGTANSRVTTAANGQGSVVSFDHQTGFVSIKFAGTDIPAAGGDGVAIFASYTPLTATKTATPTGAVDGTGAIEITHADLTAGIANNYVNVVTGAWQLKWGGNIPAVGGLVAVNYDTVAVQIEAISPGTWANGLRLQVEGTASSEVAATGAFTRYDVTLLVQNPKTLKFEAKEFFDNVSFTDAEDDRYFPLFVNETSELITVTTPAGNVGLPQLSGISRLMVLSGGDETSVGQEIYAELYGPPIQPGSLSIAWVDDTGAAMVITDDGLGNLAGDIDVAYATESNGIAANTINYTTGAINFRTSGLIRGARLVIASYYSESEDETYIETLGDATKDYSYTVGTLFELFRAGTDGTFDSTNWGRDQFTNSTLLLTDKKGLFALNRVEEIMQVAIPDFAGNATITSDLIDYAEGREAQAAGADRFVLFSPPSGYNANLAVRWFKNTLNRTTTYGAMHYPWIYITNPFNANSRKLVPPSAHVAGMFAKVDRSRGVGKAPAGKSDGKLNYLVGLEYNFDEEDRGLLNENRINVIRNDSQVQNAVFGCLTAADDAEFGLINARRLFMLAGRTLYNNSHWACFEPNNATLWNALKSQAISYLTSLFNAGQLGGDTPADSFTVVCDGTINTKETIAEGLVLMDIQIKPPKVAQFIEIRIAQLQDV